MRVVAQEWVSQDGFASGSTAGEAEIFAAVPPAADAASQDWNQRLLDDVDHVLLGRTTYESFARHWPEAHDAVAGRVNGVAKVVCSHSLEAAPWGVFPPCRVVRDAVRHLRALRDGRAGVVLVWGSLSLLHGLFEAGEVDELDLFVAPVALGAGVPLLPTPTRLRQLDVVSLRGAVHVRYALVR